MAPQSLSQALQAQHEAAMIRQAETIRDWPIPRERNEQAEIHVRFALWEKGMGRIGEETQYRIYSILSFVMPEEGAYADEMVPLEEMEQEAEWEAAYHEQLEQRSCPDCGETT